MTTYNPEFKIMLNTYVGNKLYIFQLYKSCVYISSEYVINLNIRFKDNLNIAFLAQW